MADIPGLSYSITSSPKDGGSAYKATTGNYDEVVLAISQPAEWPTDAEGVALYDKVELRLCFSNSDIKDRPWRKFKDVIKVRTAPAPSPFLSCRSCGSQLVVVWRDTGQHLGAPPCSDGSIRFGSPAQKDKQCKSTADDAALVTWDVGAIPATFPWKVKDMQPVATRSFRLLGLKDGAYTGSMGSKVCTTTDGVEECTWKDDKFVADNAPADKFVKVTAYDGLEPGIVVGAVILSIVSVTILLGYFAYERLVVAKRE